jgi:hypothetical protein
MCSKTTAKYHYKDKSFCYKYELAQYLYNSVGMTYAQICRVLYPDRVYDKCAYNTICQLVYHKRSNFKNRIDIVNKSICIQNSSIKDFTWSKIEYYDVMIGNSSLRVSSEIFNRLVTKDGVLTLE